MTNVIDITDIIEGREALSSRLGDCLVDIMQPTKKSREHCYELIRKMLAVGFMDDGSITVLEEAVRELKT